MLHLCLLSGHAKHLPDPIELLQYFDIVHMDDPAPQHSCTGKASYLEAGFAHRLVHSSQQNALDIDNTDMP
jgi:hypothetical protein